MLKVVTQWWLSLSTTDKCIPMVHISVAFQKRFFCGESTFNTILLIILIYLYVSSILTVGAFALIFIEKHWASRLMERLTWTHLHDALCISAPKSSVTREVLCSPKCKRQITSLVICWCSQLSASNTSAANTTRVKGQISVGRIGATNDTGINSPAGRYSTHTHTTQRSNCLENCPR